MMASKSKKSFTVIDRSDDTEGSNLLTELGRLPDEVVILILQMLPAQTLLLLEGSEDWLRKVVLSVKIGNFSPCPFIKLEEIQNFLKPRLHYLRELYFDNLVTGTSRQIALMISACRELKVLSLRNSGVAINHLYHILKFTKLEELSYTVINPTKNNPIRLVQGANQLHLKQLKKLTLEAGDLITFHCFILFIFPLCHDLTSIRMDISNLYKYNGFLQTNFMANFFNKREDTPNLPYLSNFVVTCPLMKTIVEEEMKKWRDQCLIPVLQWILHSQTGENNWQSFWISDSFHTAHLLRLCKVNPDKLSSASSLLFIDGQEPQCCVDILENCKQNSLCRLGVYVPKLSKNFVRLVQRAGGRQLKQLSAISSWGGTILLEIQPFYELLRCCINITDLDISGIHVTDHHDSSLCSAIAVLKDLRRLCLPICAITDVPVHISPAYLNDNEGSQFAEPTTRKRTCRHISLNHHASEVFEHMVTSCRLVEEFHLTGCSRCGVTDSGSVFCDGSIDSMYKWMQLKHVQLDHVPSLRLFTFLQHIAENCEYFTSLHITNICYHQIPTLMPSVICILKAAKNLAFLRIVHNMFDLSDDRFWVAVSKAKNLQGLCIASKHNGFIKVKTVYNAIAQLQYFHVLHLYCKTAYEKASFFAQMRTLIGRKTSRGADVQNVNFVLEVASCDNGTGLLREPHCHLHHCGIRESSVKGPHNL